MRILFVDAGNYCRSPAAETVARTHAARAGRAGQFRFGSAGLKDKHAGDTADPRTIDACRARGYGLDGFRCREITAADFASGFSASGRAPVSTMVISSLPRAFPGRLIEPSDLPFVRMLMASAYWTRCTVAVLPSRA